MLRWMSQEAALPRSCRKQCVHCRKPPLMAIGHDENHLGRSARSQVLEHTHPTILALLCTGESRQHLFVASQVHSHCCQDHRRIGLVAMTHTELDAIQVQDVPVRVPPTLAPGGELLLSILVGAADGAGNHSHQGLGDFSHGCRVLTPPKNISVSSWAICGVSRL